MRSPEVDAVDAFDLPEWLGVDQVTWSADSSLGDSHLVRGRLHTGTRRARLRCARR